MKMRFTAEIIGDDGQVVTKPVTIDTDVPEFEKFLNGSNFLEQFGYYEKAVVKARNDVAKEATGQYLDELFKKKPELRPKQTPNGE
jgi:hypothetical protein